MTKITIEKIEYKSEKRGMVQAVEVVTVILTGIPKIR